MHASPPCWGGMTTIPPSPSWERPTFPPRCECAFLVLALPIYLFFYFSPASCSPSSSRGLNHLSVLLSFPLHPPPPLPFHKVSYNESAGGLAIHHDDEASFSSEELVAMILSHAKVLFLALRRLIPLPASVLSRSLPIERGAL